MKTITFDENTHKLVPLEPDEAQLATLDHPDAAMRRVYKAMVIAAAPPAAPVAAVQQGPMNPYSGYLAKYWQSGFEGLDIDPTTRNLALTAYSEGIKARALATPPSDGVTSCEHKFVRDDDHIAHECCQKCGMVLSDGASHAAQAVGVDTPELRALLEKVLDSVELDDMSAYHDSTTALIAHITALVEQARDQGRIEGSISQHSIEKERVTSARQEGREKALEEARKYFSETGHHNTAKKIRDYAAARALSSVQPSEQGGDL